MPLLNPHGPDDSMIKSGYANPDRMSTTKTQSLGFHLGPLHVGVNRPMNSTGGLRDQGPSAIRLVCACTTTLLHAFKGLAPFQGLRRTVTPFRHTLDLNQVQVSAHGPSNYKES